MSRIGWYKRDPAAALLGMEKLSLEEVGAYNLVLDMIYERANDLQDDDRWIAGRMNVDMRVWKRIKKRLVDLGKIYISDGLIRNEVADDVVAECLARQVASRNAALIKHGKSKGKSNKNNNLTHAPACAPACADRVPSKNQERKKEESPPISPPSGGDDTDAPPSEVADDNKAKFVCYSKLAKKGASREFPIEFVEFWKVYPKKFSRSPKVAYGHWVKIANDSSVGPAEIYRAARRYSAALVQEGKEDFPKSAEKWLKDEIYLGYLSPELNPNADLFSAAHETNGAIDHGNGSVITYPANQQHHSALGSTNGKGMAAAAARCLARRQRAE